MSGFDPHDLSWEEYRAWLRQQLGKRFRHTVVLMNGEPRLLEGQVLEKDGGVSLYYSGWSFPGKDPNWYNARRHYPWEEVTHAGKI